jgi:hypothetical protein
MADIEIAKIERKERRKQAIIHFFSHWRVTVAPKSELTQSGVRM